MNQIHQLMKVFVLWTTKIVGARRSHKIISLTCLDHNI